MMKTDLGLESERMKNEFSVRVKRRLSFFSGTTSSGRRAKGFWGRRKRSRSELSTGRRGKITKQTDSIVYRSSVRLQPTTNFEKSRRHGVDDLSFSGGTDVEKIVSVLGCDVDELVNDLLDRSDAKEENVIRRTRRWPTLSQDVRKTAHLY